jgi:hypothetical protein
MQWDPGRLAPRCWVPGYSENYQCTVENHETCFWLHPCKLSLRDRNLHYNYFFFYKAGGRTVDGAVVRRNSGEVEVGKLVFLRLR